MIVNAVIALSIALWAQTIYELSILAWTLLLVGLFVPFAFGMYWKKANSWGAVAAFVGGLHSLDPGYNLLLQHRAGWTIHCRGLRVHGRSGRLQRGMVVCVVGCGLHRLLRCVLRLSDTDGCGCFTHPKGFTTQEIGGLLW